MKQKWYASGCPVYKYRPARKVSQASLSIFKSRRRGARPSKVSQSQHRRQLHPARPLQGRSSGRASANHLRGLPFPSLGQGDLAPGFAGSLLLALSSSCCLSLCLINLNCIVPARLIPKPHVLLTRQQHLQHHIRLTVSCHSSAALPQRKTRRRESLGGIWNPFPVSTPASISRSTRPPFVHALTSKIQHTTKFLLPSPSRSLALSDTPLPVPISLRTRCAASYFTTTPNERPETPQK